MQLQQVLPFACKAAASVANVSHALYVLLYACLAHQTVLMSTYPSAYALYVSWCVDD